MARSLLITFNSSVAGSVTCSGKKNILSSTYLFASSVPNNYYSLVGETIRGEIFCVLANEIIGELS